MKEAYLSDRLIKDLEIRNIDVNLTLEILNNYNSGNYDHISPTRVGSLPDLDGKTIIPLTPSFSLTLPLEEAEKNMKSSGLAAPLFDFGTVIKDKISFSYRQLQILGTALFPMVSYGILNGGSASSFFDRKKNRSFNPDLFNIYEPYFNEASKQYKSLPKGLIPAFYNKDGSPGPSFIELKMRNILLLSMEYEEIRKKYNLPDSGTPLFPMFQMTSPSTESPLKEFYSAYPKGDILGELISKTGIPVHKVLTGVQPLLAAFTHSKEGNRKNIFLNAFGKENSPLPLPGGHGQNFMILKDIYQKLFNEGKKFIYLGNVDNLGYTVNSAAVALLAITGKEAGFDFAFKTPVDIKGGILVRDTENRLTCADIGPAISKEEVQKAENTGKRILFNCATGLFSLEYLVSNIDKIIRNLPTRFTDQEKDAGSYSQAEQVTWEILGILERPFIFGVNKFNRFLSAKIVMETFMTSGLHLDDDNFPVSKKPEDDLKRITQKMYSGLKEKLALEYGMALKENRWIPRKYSAIKKELQEKQRG